MTQIDVAIVGAGAAGIAAGRMLVQAGLRVRLLEARARPGGRARTDLRLGFPVDLGAAWLHFATGNPFTGIADLGGFTVIRRNPNWGPEVRIGARAPTPAEREYAAQSWQRYQALIEAAAAAGRDVPLSEVLPLDAYRTRFDSVMTWAVGAESRDVSTLDFARYADSTHNWSVAEGLGAVVAHAAAGLPVTTGVRVQRVALAGDGVRLDTTAGRVDAHTALITVPTGVLAAGDIRFDPPLPAAHRHAIEALPLGIVNKVFFRIAAEKLPFADTTQLIGSIDSPRTASYTVRPAGQPAISAFFGGDLSRELEDAGQLEEFARAELHSLFGPELTDGIEVALATGWGRDPFARGSYSAARPGCADQRQVLAQPVTPRLILAGEACSTAWYGTLNGAWQSGRDAAVALLYLLRPDTPQA